MGRCNPVAERWPAPADPFVRLNEKKANQIYVSYAAATAGIRLHIPRAPPEMLAAMLSNDRKPPHGIKPFDCRPPEKYRACVPLSSSFLPLHNGAKHGYDLMRGGSRPPPPKPYYVGAQPTVPPPPYSASGPPCPAAGMGVKVQGPKSDVGGGQQSTNTGSSHETHSTDQVNKILAPELKAGSTIDETATTELLVHTARPPVEGFAIIKIEEDDTKEANFEMSGVGNVADAPILASHHSAIDSKRDAYDLEIYAKSSSDSTPARRSGPTGLSDRLVRHLLAGPMDRLSKVIQVIIKYSRILQNLRNHDCQQLGVPPDTPLGRPTPVSPHTWGTRKWLALGSILLCYSLGQGTGGFDPSRFAYSSDLSQMPGDPNTPLGNVGGNIWSGRGPDFEELTLLGQDSCSSFEELFQSFGQVQDVLARPPYGPTNDSPVAQPESPPIQLPPLDSETPCAKSYSDGFNDAIAMIFAALQGQAPPTQPNTMAMNETLTPCHPPPSFAFRQEGQTGAGFPPDCPGPNARPTISPLVNDPPQDVFASTAQPPHQEITFNPHAYSALNVDMPRLEQGSQPQCFETDRGQSAHPTQLAPPTNADLTPAPALPFSLERQPSRVTRPTQYICAHCSKSYRKPYQLRDHIKCKHEGGVRSYCCGHDGCGKTFTTRSNLARHVKKEHQAGNVSVVSQRDEGRALEASNEPARAAGSSTRRRRAADPFVVCTPDAMRCKQHRRK